MKSKTLITTLMLTLSFAGTAYAATPTPTTSTSQLENTQINQLKNKIASQVSQLKLVEKRGIIGTIQAVTDNQITLQDIHQQVRYVDLDEITKYESLSGSSLDLTDIKKGMQVSVFGIYNKDSQRILARFVSVATIPTRYYGEIVAIDKPNFDVTIMTDDQKSQKVEIDTSSTVSSYTGGSSTSTYGFSKLSVGDRVEVIGYPDKTNSSLLEVDRMIDYLDVPKDPNISFVTPTPVVTLAPKSKGAKSISPIK
jgi:uncharacterized protein DUF5666